MDKMNFETAELTQGNVEKLAEIFPSVITEARDENGHLKKAVNFDALRQLLSSDAVYGDEAYEFTWVGKKEAIVEAGRPIRKTLRPCPEESKNWDTTENLYIEGDNLDVLKLLQENYLGKVKMIYIDPPYNTGNDFIYRDNFTVGKQDWQAQSGEIVENKDGERQRLFKNTDSNGRFHSDWCSMIYPRLMLARNLLSDDGAIFISCDDNELENLRRICNEIYGEDNFRNTILVRRRIKSLNSQFSKSGLQRLNIGFEYILVYSKSVDFTMNPIRMKKLNTSIKGRWDVFWSNADRPTMRYDILGFTPITGQWRTSKEKADIAVENYKIFMDEFSNKMTLEEYYEYTGINSFIRRIENGIGKNGGVQHWIPPSDTAIRTTNWTDIEVSQISKEIDLPFDNPKSKTLILELIKLATCGDNSIFMDFFSGSATTAHAVMQLNAEDGGKRQFIMVQLPEECPSDSEAAKAGYRNICEIGKERIRRAGEKIKKENAGKEGIENLDIGFRVLKCDSSNMKDVYYAPQNTCQSDLDDLISNIKEDRTDLDLLFGCLLEWGLPLSLPYKTEQICGHAVHFYDYAKNTDNGAALAACFDANISEEAIMEIARRKPLRAVFRDSSFATSGERINAGELFKTLAPDTAVKVI